MELGQSIIAVTARCDIFSRRLQQVCMSELAEGAEVEHALKLCGIRDWSIWSSILAMKLFREDGE